MELIYAIADNLGIPNEFIIMDKVDAKGNCAWFHTKAGARYSCRTVRNGKFLKKNSVRID
jgi:hypothetical protein